MKEPIYCGLLGSIENIIIGEIIPIRATAGSSIALPGQRRRSHCGYMGSPKGTI